MRPIIFRGKDVKTGEWHKGGFTMDAAGEPRITTVSKDGEGLVFNEVVSDTVGQFIINEDGYDIFEGDIIRELKHNHIVRMFIAEDVRTFTREYDTAEHSSTWEVLATIHDDKHLLTND